jgi:hypothetical protein
MSTSSSSSSPSTNDTLSSSVSSHPLFDDADADDDVITETSDNTDTTSHVERCDSNTNELEPNTLSEETSDELSSSADDAPVARSKGKSLTDDNVHVLNGSIERFDICVESFDATKPLAATIFASESPVSWKDHQTGVVENSEANVPMPTGDKESFSSARLTDVTSDDDDDKVNDEDQSTQSEVQWHITSTDDDLDEGDGRQLSDAEIEVAVLNCSEEIIRRSSDKNVPLPSEKDATEKGDEEMGNNKEAKISFGQTSDSESSHSKQNGDDDDAGDILDDESCDEPVILQPTANMIDKQLTSVEERLDDSIGLRQQFNYGINCRQTDVIVLASDGDDNQEVDDASDALFAGEMTDRRQVAEAEQCERGHETVRVRSTKAFECSDKNEKEERPAIGNSEGSNANEIANDYNHPITQNEVICSQFEMQSGSTSADEKCVPCDEIRQDSNTSHGNSEARSNQILNFSSEGSGSMMASVDDLRETSDKRHQKQMENSNSDTSTEDTQTPNEYDQATIEQKKTTHSKSSTKSSSFERMTSFEILKTDEITAMRSEPSTSSSAHLRDSDDSLDDGEIDSGRQQSPWRRNGVDSGEERVAKEPAGVNSYEYSCTRKVRESAVSNDGRQYCTNPRNLNASDDNGTAADNIETVGIYRGDCTIAVEAATDSLSTCSDNRDRQGAKLVSLSDSSHYTPSEESPNYMAEGSDINQVLDCEDSSVLDSDVRQKHQRKPEVAEERPAVDQQIQNAKQTLIYLLPKVMHRDQVKFCSSGSTRSEKLPCSTDRESSSDVEHTDEKPAKKLKINPEDQRLLQQLKPIDIYRRSASVDLSSEADIPASVTECQQLRRIASLDPANEKRAFSGLSPAASVEGIPGDVSSYCRNFSIEVRLSDGETSEYDDGRRMSTSTSKAENVAASGERTRRLTATRKSVTFALDEVRQIDFEPYVNDVEDQLFDESSATLSDSCRHQADKDERENDNGDVRLTASVQVSDRSEIANSSASVQSVNRRPTNLVCATRRSHFSLNSLLQQRSEPLSTVTAANSSVSVDSSPVLTAVRKPTTPTTISSGHGATVLSPRSPSRRRRKQPISPDVSGDFNNNDVNNMRQNWCISLSSSSVSTKGSPCYTVTLDVQQPLVAGSGNNNNKNADKVGRLRCASVPTPSELCLQTVNVSHDACRQTVSTSSDDCDLLVLLSHMKYLASSSMQPSTQLPASRSLSGDCIVNNDSVIYTSNTDGSFNTRFSDLHSASSKLMSNVESARGSIYSTGPVDTAVLLQQPADASVNCSSDYGTSRQSLETEARSDFYRQTISSSSVSPSMEKQMQQQQQQQQQQRQARRYIRRSSSTSSTGFSGETETMPDQMSPKDMWTAVGMAYSRRGSLSCPSSPPGVTRNTQNLNVLSGASVGVNAGQQPDQMPLIVGRSSEWLNHQSLRYRSVTPTRRSSSYRTILPPLDMDKV